MLIYTKKTNRGIRAAYTRGEVSKVRVTPKDFALTREAAHQQAAMALVHEMFPTFKGTLIGTNVDAKTVVWVWVEDPTRSENLKRRFA